MTNQEIAFEHLREHIKEMMELVQRQLNDSKEAFFSYDTDLANQIIHLENHVNALEISVNKECENILALFHPLATDLRYVMAVLSVSAQLERIGDHAEAIAKYIRKGTLAGSPEPLLLAAVQLETLFEVSMSMLDDVIYGFLMEDIKISKLVFGKDVGLNKISHEAPKQLAQYCRDHPEQAEACFYVFSIVKKLERVGDLTKNVAEETIFYTEAKIVKHQKKK